MKRQLNEQIAVLKGAKERTKTQIDVLHHSLQKPDIFNGLEKTYRSLNEDDTEKLPGESKKVQSHVEEVFNTVAQKMADLSNIILTVETGNSTALENIKIGDTVLAKDVPVTYLIQLEKTLVDCRTIIDKAPTLNPIYNWSFDTNQQLYKSEMVTTTRTKKTSSFVVAAPATEQHPAQVKEVVNDNLAGYWDKMELSGQISVERKEQLLSRVEALLRAVKEARERANSISVEVRNDANNIFTYIFGK